MMPGSWLLIMVAAVIICAAVAVLIGQARDVARAGQMRQQLLDSASQPPATIVDFASFSELPAPVARYFRHALTDGQPMIKVASVQQTGVLRTTTTARNWLAFSASQLVVPAARGFVWNARVNMPLAGHVRVIDSYLNAVGSSTVSLLSAFAVASEAGAPQLNSAALHRYLAEGVWFPTALLPQSGVKWSQLDANSALATLTNNGSSVSLEFRFNEVGEVTAIYTDGRFGKFKGEYKQVPWQGHFRDYRVQDGIRIPRYGEVGWFDNGVLQLVWQGDLIRVQYQFEP